MKKLSIVFLAVVMAVAFGFTTVNADPSAKATAQLGDLSVVDVSGSNTTIEDTPICVDGDGTVIACEDTITGYEGDPPTPICVDGDGTVIACEDTIIGYTNNTGWETLFTQKIKTPNGKDLFINVSLECGLTTDTTVMSKKLVRAIAKAEAIVEVQVLVDDVPVPVNGKEPADTDITFARRHQTLIAEFAGDISGAISVDPDTGEVTIDPALIEPEMLQLILDTMQANSFNFIVPDLSADLHTVKIQAKLSYMAFGNLAQETIDSATLTMAEGEAFAKAYLGNGSVTIECVRMIKDENVVVDLD